MTDLVVGMIFFTDYLIHLEVANDMFGPFEYCKNIHISDVYSLCVAHPEPYADKLYMVRGHLRELIIDFHSFENR